MSGEFGSTPSGRCAARTRDLLLVRQKPVRSQARRRAKPVHTSPYGYAIQYGQRNAFETLNETTGVNMTSKERRRMLKRSVARRVGRAQAQRVAHAMAAVVNGPIGSGACGYGQSGCASRHGGVCVCAVPDKLRVALDEKQNSLEGR